MDPRLYAFAVNGDHVQLRALIEWEEHLLEMSETATSKGNNILHIAAIYGHVQFAREALAAKPELSSELNKAGLSPLHLAAAKGHLDLVKLLLDVDPDLSSFRDKHGRHPAHTAAMNGRVDVLNEIISVDPCCLKETTDKGETVLHLSVKERRIEVVQYLVSREEIKGIVNKRDCGGNTALHLAAARNQKEIIKEIFAQGSIVRSIVNVNVFNKYGITPCELFRRRLSSLERRLDENVEILKLLSPTVRCFNLTRHRTVPADELKKREWSKLVDNAMIVAVLVATVTFQAAVTPPGGFWQDNSSADSTMKAVVGASSPSAPSPSVISTPNSLGQKHTAGTAVIPALTYERFIYWDFMAFLSSLLIIFFLVLTKAKGLPEHAIAVVLLMYVLMAIVTMVVAFYYAIEATSPLGSHAAKNVKYILVAIGIFLWLLVLIFGGRSSVRDVY